MKRISWITGDYFLDTDINIIRYLCSYYDINWIIIINRNSTIDYEKYVKSSLGTTHISLSFIYLKERSRSLKIIRTYYDIIKKAKSFTPDIYYLSFIGIPYGLFLYKQMLPIEKCVIPCHNVTTPKGAKIEKIAKIYTHFWLNTFKNIQVFSKGQYNKLTEKYKNKNVLYAPMVIKDYGEPTNQIDKLNSSIIRFLFFGNIVEYKQLDILIDATNILAKQGFRFKVRIAGACNNWKKYQMLIKYPDYFELEIKRIPNEDVANLFGDSHYFVMPYQDIAQSGAITVAFRYNLPVICSNIKPFKEFVKDNETGFMFEKGNANSLAEKMKWIIENHSKIYESVCTKEQHFVEKNFSLNTIINKYQSYIGKI